MLIYQLLPRIFGNDKLPTLPHGDISQNGCGKMNDITKTFLRKLKELGTTHVWYTGLLEHATTTDYSAYGIRKDHAAVVKGKAGSPYAVKDYYDIDPDLASSPEKRLKEFGALVERTHAVGLRMVMDFVPNHVARQYCSDAKPSGVKDFGADDNPLQAFSPQNNFYYIPGEPLRGQFNMTATEQAPYREFPAKATGNDCFTPCPTQHDWYETVKLNYGIDYGGGHQERFTPIPDTWHKMLHILLHWCAMGVDGFRCDMAEMVPCAFWNWAIAQVRDQFPDVIFIGEVYQPSRYREYLHHGRFDYLYDKVGLYDTLRAVMREERPASDLSECWKQVGDIQGHMLNFLENHDEQRIASDFFAGKMEKGRPALIVASCMNVNPFMLYFGQELGERGMNAEGYSGLDGRTSIFDYCALPLISEWRNGGKYTLEKLSAPNRELYTYYKKVLRLSQTERTLTEGRFFDLMYVNPLSPIFDAQHLYAFIRQAGNEAIFVIANFSDQDQEAQLTIPGHALQFLGIPAGNHKATELLTRRKLSIRMEADQAIGVSVPAQSGTFLKITY
ncbi:MAG: alpha-amylase [Bacteroidaceae bacterium]|nr:alpha-amylase [Bacteroidaceae bacterium]